MILRCTASYNDIPLYMAPAAFKVSLFIILRRDQAQLLSPIPNYNTHLTTQCIITVVYYTLLNTESLASNAVAIYR